MDEPLAAAILFGYLFVTLAIGVAARRAGGEGATEFVAGGRSFGPLVMYFVLGATVFSAFALLGTPQRTMAKGSEVFYLLAYGSLGFAPLFFFGARVGRIGRREGYLTQAEFLGGRFDSRLVCAICGVSGLLASIPYLVIQFKGAGIVMEAVLGWPRVWGAAVVYGVVALYILLGGVRGVGWTNVLQGIAMMVAVWWLGLYVPDALFGGVAGMFDRLAAEHPAHLTLPGPANVSHAQYASEVLVTALGFSMWPHLFMKCFTAKNARLVQFSAAMFPSFLLFMVPLMFLGYCGLLLDGPADDSLLIWLVRHPTLDLGPVSIACVCFAILAASMSTGDALLHACGAMAVRDVWIGGLGRTLDDRTQAQAMRVLIVVLVLLVLWLFDSGLGGVSIVNLLLYGYALPIQTLPLVIAALYWRRANRAGACAGLVTGTTSVLALFALAQFFPEQYAALNPYQVHPGIIGGALNVLALIAGSLSAPRMECSLLERFAPA